MNPKIKTYLGFALKSGAVVFGTDAIAQAKRSPALVVFDAELAENSRKKLSSHCEKKRIPAVEIEALPALLNRNNTLAIGVTNQQLASAILRESEKETEYGYGKRE